MQNFLVVENNSNVFTVEGGRRKREPTPARLNFLEYNMKSLASATKYTMGKLQINIHYHKYQNIKDVTYIQEAFPSSHE